MHQDDGFVTVRTDSVPLRVWFVTDDVVRLRAGFDGDFAEESYTLVRTAWPDRLDAVVTGRQRVLPAPAELTDGPERATLVGRRLVVEIDKDPFAIAVRDADGTLLHSDVVDLGYQEDSNGRRIHTSRIEPDDRFYGLGESTGPLDKARRLLTLSPRDAMGYDPQETDPLYKHIPFYIRLGRRSRAAVGYFYHHTHECDVDLGRARSNYWPPHSRYRVNGGDIDLFLIAGPAIRDVVRRYAELTGTSVMLPKTALGYLGSSMYYPELPADADAAIVEFIDTTRSYDIPVDGFQLSSGYTQQETSAGLRRCVLTWNTTRFPDPAGFIAEMASRGITVSPNVKPGVLLVHPRIEEMREAGLFVRDSERDEPAVGTWWGGPGVFVDFTSPVARDEWKRRISEAVLCAGTASVWNDNCEYDGLVDRDARCDFEGAGSTIGALAAVMPNLMCEVSAQAVREVHGDLRPFIVCRSGHSGIQRHAQTWSGDNVTSWESLRHNIATMLGMSLSGVANQGTDTCGFYGPAPDAELMVRWIQHGVFQPRFSIHSVNVDNTVTQPWMYSAHTHLVREAIEWRYRLFPYLYSLMARAHRDGTPIVEPMVSLFQHDPRCDAEGVDFMLGDSLLVAGVVEPGVSSRSVYLPAGERFYDLHTRAPHDGGQVVQRKVDLGTIPLFLRGGGIVPLSCDRLDNLATQVVTGVHLLCAPDRDGVFALYEDDGVSRAHETGASVTTHITMTAGEQVTLEFAREGPYPSAVRRWLLDVVHPGKAPYWVSVDDEIVPQLLDRHRFEATQTGWYYSQTSRSVQVRLPDPGRDFRVVISFEHVDMIGI